MEIKHRQQRRTVRVSGDIDLCQAATSAHGASFCDIPKRIGSSGRNQGIMSARERLEADNVPTIPAGPKALCKLASISANIEDYIGSEATTCLDETLICVFDEPNTFFRV